MNDKTVKDVLIEARALIAPSYCWTKGVWNRKRKVPKKDTFCNCYCAVGAVRQASGYDKPGSNPGAAQLYLKAEMALDLVARNDFGAYGAIEFNDSKSTTKKDVLAMFDKAIEAVA